MEKQRALRIGLIVVIIGAVLLFLPYLPWLPFQIAYDSPPKPKIKYGEFPFEITYEIDGEVKTVQDVLICEYDGVKLTANGKYRKWKQYLKSNKNEEYFFVTEKDGIKIYIIVGGAKYYMSDSNLRGGFVGYEKPITPGTIAMEVFENGKMSSIGLDNAGVYEKYGVRVIDYKLSEPIVNSFG